LELVVGVVEAWCSTFRGGERKKKKNILAKRDVPAGFGCEPFESLDLAIMKVGGRITLAGKAAGRWALDPVGILIRDSG